MRITPNITAQNSLYNIQKSRSQLDSIQEKLASEMNYNRPSDDPVAARLLTGIADKLRANSQYDSNITKANNWLKMTDTALTSMNKTMDLVKNVTSTVSGGSADSTTMTNAISQLTALREQLADLGNTQVDNQYVFAGTNTTVKPFDRTVNSSPPATQPAPLDTTYYSGNDQVNNVEIDAGATEKLNLPGSSVLTGPDANVLWSLDSLISTLKNNPSDLTTIQARANELESGASQIQNAQVTNATRIKRLDIMSTMQANTKNSLETVYSNVQNIDYAKLAVELQQQQTSFQATLSATAKISQMSLLDYL